MENKKLNILIISYYFPPFNRVGGRRWAKHCKYLNKENINFFVLAGDHKGKSSWDQDITYYADRIFRVRLPEIKKPYFGRDLPQTILQKIRWKLSYWMWEGKKKRLKGNYLDPSRIVESDFYTVACKIIEDNNLNMVLLSGNPFDYSIILAKIKKRYPSLKCVMDYRGYWEDELNGLTDRQKKEEADLQSQVITSCSMITSPNKEMQHFYAEKFGKKSVLLPHCVDEDDFSKLIYASKKTNKDVLRLIYGGAFYSGIENNLGIIKKVLEAFNLKMPAHADFYVSVKGYESETNDANITRHGFIPTTEYFQEVVNSDYVILILPPNRVNAMSSKFFELVALRKAILYFGGHGEVSNFIVANKLGYHVTEKNINEIVSYCLSNRSSQSVPDLKYDIRQHTFEFQTKELIKQLQEL